MLGVIELASFNSFTPVQTRLPRAADRDHRRQRQHDHRQRAHRRAARGVAAAHRRAPGAVRGAAGPAGRAAALQRRAGGQGGAAGRAEPRHRDQERRDRAGQAGAGGPRPAARAGLEVQVASSSRTCSHELRTPLNSLLILAQLLAQNPGRNLTAKQVEYANVIHSAGSDLLQLINDILDLSKVEAGQMDIHPERFPLRRAARGRPGHVPAADRARRAWTSPSSTARRGARPTCSPTGSGCARCSQPAVERGQVHRARAACCCAIEPGRAASCPDGAARCWHRLPGGRHRHRHRAEQHLSTIFGAFQQADGTHQPEVRRHRPRPVHQPRGRRTCSAGRSPRRASSAAAAPSPCTCR